MRPEIATAIKTILATLPEGADLRFYWQDGAQHLHMSLPGQPDQVVKLNRAANCSGVIVPAQQH
jgi:hypothetical protein